MKTDINKTKRIIAQLGYQYEQLEQGKLSLSKNNKPVGLLVFATNKVFINGKVCRNPKQWLINQM